jgi:voltage-dependent potassium channel beta subunit
MPLAVLGRSGLLVSRLAYGSWVTFSDQIDIDSAQPCQREKAEEKQQAAAKAESREREGAYALMVAAYKGGINLFDTAETYANGRAESIMGACIQRGIEEGVWTREDLVISTKLFFGYRAGPNQIGLSRKHIMEGTVASLARLRLAYVDLLLCHRPDPITPIEETVRAMNAMITCNKALYWGTSMWSVSQIEEAIGVCDRLGLIRPVVEQTEYNMFTREKMESEFLPLFRKYGLGITAFSPLASGVLSGKYKGGEIPPGSRLSLQNYGYVKEAKFGSESYQIDVAEKLRPVADRLGCKLSQLAIAWTLKNDNCTTTILGATKMHQLEENLKALEVMPLLTSDIMEEIEAIVHCKPSLCKVDQQVREFRKADRVHGLLC